ncbi:8785_t:CDS:2, partial [Ambispora leptoticha]
PDLSCVVNGVPILNSKYKPLGSTPLQRMKDRLKVQLRARKSINQQLQSKGGPGEAVILLNVIQWNLTLWISIIPFLTTRLVVDKTMIPLAGVAIHHLVSLEEHVERIAKDFKYRTCRSDITTPTEQMSFMRKFPDSPQVKKLIH